MKIIDIKTTIVNAEMRNWVFVKVITDDDIYGWGEATVEWKTRAVVGAIEDIKPLLIGKDPRNIKQNFQIMTKHGFWKMGVIGMTSNQWNRTCIMGYSWKKFKYFSLAITRW